MFSPFNFNLIGIRNITSKSFDGQRRSYIVLSYPIGLSCMLTGDSCHAEGSKAVLFHFTSPWMKRFSPGNRASNACVIHTEEKFSRSNPASNACVLHGSVRSGPVRCPVRTCSLRGSTSYVEYLNDNNTTNLSCCQQTYRYARSMVRCT